MAEHVLDVGTWMIRDGRMRYFALAASDDVHGCLMDGTHAGDRTGRARMHGDRFRGAREREGTWMVLGILWDVLAIDCVKRLCGNGDFSFQHSRKTDDTTS